MMCGDLILCIGCSLVFEIRGSHSKMEPDEHKLAKGEV